MASLDKGASPADLARDRWDPRVLLQNEHVDSLSDVNRTIMI